MFQTPTSRSPYSMHTGRNTRKRVAAFSLPFMREVRGYCGHEMYSFN